MQAIVDQKNVMAVIGPQQSGIASGQIPISNAAGLLQCSPSAASDGLTKPDAGALKLRSSQPKRINFVRTVATNSSDAPGTAKFILENLRRSNVYVVDNTVATARQRADLFSGVFHPARWHGRRTWFAGQGGDGPDRHRRGCHRQATGCPVLQRIGQCREIVARFFKATRKDFGAVPFVASGEIKADTTFRDPAGADLGTNVFASLAAADDFPGKTEFSLRYQAVYGVAPDTYSATAHACATVILDAIGRAGDATDLADLRERVRAAAVDPSVTHTSVLGDFTFDENGDTDPQTITIYRYVPRTTHWGDRGVHPLRRVTTTTRPQSRIVRHGTDARRNPRRPVLRPTSASSGRRSTTGASRAGGSRSRARTCRRGARARRRASGRAPRLEIGVTHWRPNPSARRCRSRVASPPRGTGTS